MCIKTYAAANVYDTRRARRVQYNILLYYVSWYIHICVCIAAIIYYIIVFWKLLFLSFYFVFLIIQPAINIIIIKPSTFIHYIRSVYNIYACVESNESAGKYTWIHTWTDIRHDSPNTFTHIFSSLIYLNSDFPNY